MITAAYAPTGIKRWCVPTILAALVLPACHRGANEEPAKPGPAAARDEVLFNCREANGATLSLTIRGDRAVLGYANGAQDEATVVASPEQYILRMRDIPGEYRIDRVNGQLAFWFSGKPLTNAPGECKRIEKRLGE